MLYARRRVRSTAPVDHKTLSSRSHAQHRRCSLASLGRHPKQRLIEGHGTLLVRDAEREALEVADDEHAFEGRQARTPFAQDSRSAAIAHVLNLEPYPIGIVDVKLRRPFLGAAVLLTAHSDPRLHWTG